MQQHIRQSARILIVDDEPANVLLLERLLGEWGFAHVRSTSDPYQALPMYLEFSPHMVLLDLMMDGLDGYGVMQQLLAAADDGARATIVVLTADATVQAKRQALELGAQDFLAKPFDVIELSLRLNNLLEINFLHQQLRDQNLILENRVAERTSQLAESECETAICLGIAGEYRDDDTGRHTQRVGATAVLLAKYNPHANIDADLIAMAAPLHDVGKIGVPDSILLKPGRLTPEEFDTMKAHCRIGQAILSRHSTPLLQLASSIAISHHERWDGTGYPAGLAGEDIPIEGRMVAIADVFDALTHARPYKEPWPVEQAVSEIQSQSGRQFDPHLVDTFSAHLDEVLRSTHDSSL